MPESPRRAPRLLLTLLTASLFAGCQAGTREAPTAADPTDALPIARGDADAFGYVIAWPSAVTLPPGQRLVGVEVINDQLVTLESPSPMATAVGLRAGDLRWRTVMGNGNQRLWGPYAATDPLPPDATNEDLANRRTQVLVNGPQHMYHYDAETGDRLAISELETRVTAAPAVFPPFAIFRTSGDRLFAHSVTAGYTIYEVQFSAPVKVKPTVSGELVFAADANGIMKVFEGATGTHVWTQDNYGKVAAQAAAIDNGFAVPSLDQTLYGFNAYTGTPLWTFRRDEPITASPTTVDNLVLLPREQEGLVAIDAGTGRELWVYDDITGRPVMIADGKLLLAYETRLELVDVATGELAAEVETRPLAAVREGPEKSIILVGQNGYIVRLNPRQ